MAQVTKVKLCNPKILTWAREESGLSVPEVARRFKKTQAIIEAWERGDEAPTFRQLVELANYYKRPVAAFFLPSIPPRTPKPHDYRTLPGITPGEYLRETLLAYREVYNMLAEARELLNELNPDVVFSLPTWTIDDAPEQKAEQIRSLLGISIEKQIKEFDTHYTAQDVWRSVLFDHGVIVRICKMPIADARAFCLFGNDLAGIGLSNEDREHGRIFSLFHEVCHLSLKQPGVSGLASNYRSSNQRLEQYCDRFSASFLLPSSHPEVTESLKLFGGSIDPLEVAQFIANKFKVSKYVAIRRAFDLQKISPDIYWDTIAQWKRIDARRKREGKRTGGNYPATQINYIGKRFIGLVMEALRRNYFTSVDVRRTVGLDPASIELNL
jgi:Zn-dependent peptidase ImmA (M78 family)/transcriptional regulator with XRE-family HTH domain